MDWKDQYKHPQWQRRRLEALKSAEFSCENCGDSDTQLHVHHKRYVKGRKIWEYGPEELCVMCEYCHEEWHKEKSMLDQLLAMMGVEAIGDIYALVFGYAKTINGPASVDVSDLPVPESVHITTAGEIAGNAQLLICQAIAWRLALRNDQGNQNGEN